MAWQFPNVRTVVGMVSTGLQKLANWLFGRMESDEGRIQFLSSRYPNASRAVLLRGLEEVRRGTQAGSLFDLGPEHPEPAAIPIDPTIRSRGNYAYQVDVTGRGYLGGTGRGRPPNIIDRFHIFYSDSPLSRQELMEAVRQFLIDQLSGPNDYGFAQHPNARLTSFDAAVISITRSA